MSHRHRLVALWTAASLVLLVALFPVFDTTPADVTRGLMAAPWSMYGTVLALTVINQLAGAERWRLAAAHLSDGAARHSRGHAFETTALGAFLGQVVPIQLSTAMVRGMLGAKTQGGARTAVGATVHEQAYDLVVLLPAAVAGAIALLGDWSIAASAALMLAAVACAIAVAPQLFGAARAVAVFVRDRSHGRLARVLDVANTALFGASGVPRNASVVLGLLSVVRAVCMAGRVVVIAAVLAPDADPVGVALGYPTVGIIGAMPLTPAGLGLVEWSWSGLLVHAGALPSAAATAAISMRLVNMMVLGVIMAVLVALRVGRPARG